MSASTFLSGNSAGITPVLSVRQYWAAGTAAGAILLADTRFTESSVVTCSRLGAAVRATEPLLAFGAPVIRVGVSAFIDCAAVATTAVEVEWTVMKF